MKLKEGTYSNSFQSRLLKDPWLKPYTDFELKSFPDKGINKLAVVTPAFVTDCLETLEEIEIRGKEEFENAGGKKFQFIPCLNDNEEWVLVVEGWIKEWLNKN